MPLTDSESRLAQRIELAIPGVTPGVSLQVYRGGDLLYDIRVGQTHPYYDLASLTKLIFTQQAMMAAFDQGKWDFATTVAEVLTDFPERGVRLQELLTHTSGIEWWKPFYLSLDPALSWRQKRAWLYGELKKADFSRTGKAVYSDLGFMLLGFVLEQMNARDLLEEWTAIKSSYYAHTTLDFHIDNRTDTAPDQFAPTEDCPWRKKILRGEVHDDNTLALGGISTHAGLFGSVDDVSAFGLQLRAQLLGVARQIRQETAQLFARRAIPREAGDWASGYMLPSAQGASCGTHFSPDSIGHTGFTGTSIWYDPHADLLVSVLSNRVHYGRDNKAFIALRPVIHDWIVESL